MKHQEKGRLRREILMLRKAMSSREVMEKSELIKAALLNTYNYKNAKEIFIYVDHENEVTTRSIISQGFRDSKKIAVPRVLSKGIMAFYLIDSIEGLVKSSMNIYEPDTSCIEIKPSLNSLVILPGVVYDHNRNRIGYGGGYYDQYMAQFKGINNLAICYDYQVMDAIPYDNHDIRPDKIITECRIIV